jgi:hypothetical protein
MKGISMTNPRRGRPIRTGLVLLLMSALALTTAPRAVNAASTTPVDLYLTGVVSHGPDAGVTFDGALTLTPDASGKVTGKFSTFAGALISRFSSYTPITVTGTLGTKSANLTFDLSGMSAMTAGGKMPAGMAMPHFANLGTHSTLHGTGQLLADGSYVGSFSGPDSADSGSWTATPAVAHGFDFSAASKSGPKVSMSGQAAVVFGADGTIDGLYVSDDLKAVYPIHGVVGNNWMSLVLPTGNGQVLYGSGHAGNIDVYQFYSGSFYGPTAATSGTWSAAFTS